MSKLFGSLETKTTEAMNKCEKLLDLTFKASGSSVMDMLEIDAETGAMIGGCMELYRDSKELKVMEAKAMDKVLEDLDELRVMNDNLRKQNETLQQMLQDLSRKVEKIGK